MAFDRENITNIARYKGYYHKVLPLFKNGKTRSYSTLILSFLAASFFGIFAINPTLTTISELQRKLKDAETITVSLDSKINNLVALRKQYQSLETDLPVVFNALPAKSQAAVLMGKIKALAARHHIELTGLQILEVKLSADLATKDTLTPFYFTLAGSGTYENIGNLLSSMLNLDRLVTIETFSVAKPVIKEETGELTFTTKGISYIFFEDD